jgi:hypothetical protein
LAKIIVDDLHVHRLRQICIIIQEKLGSRFGLPDEEGSAETLPPADEKPKDDTAAENNVTPIKPLTA